MSVAVIIPFYNEQNYIAEAIQSCIIQKEISQIILVDDGSEDNSLSIVRGFSKSDPRIELHVHKKNRGRSAARNTGLEHVRSDYFSFLDADDYYLPVRFSEALSKLNNNKEIQGTYEGVRSYFDKNIINTNSSVEDITMIQDQVEPDKLFEYLVMGKGHFSILGGLFKKEVIQQSLKFDESLEVGEDTDWIWRVSHHYRLEGLHADIKVVRRVHGENSYFNDESNKWKVAFYQKWQKEIPNYDNRKHITQKVNKSYYHFKMKSSKGIKAKMYLAIKKLLKA